MFLRILVMIFVGIFEIGSFPDTITKPYPIFWPLTFIISYRGAWEQLLSKAKLLRTTLPLTRTKFCASVGFRGKLNFRPKFGLKACAQTEKYGNIYVSNIPPCYVIANLFWFDKFCYIFCI